MTFESYPKSTSMREPNFEQSEKYSIANDDYTVFSVIPLGLRNTPLRITRFNLIYNFFVAQFPYNLFPVGIPVNMGDYRLYSLK